MPEDEGLMFSERLKQIPVFAYLSRGAVITFMHAYKLHQKRDDRITHFLDIYFHWHNNRIY